MDVKTIADLGIDPATVGAANRKVKIKKLNFPPQRQAVKMIEGETVRDKAAELVRVLHEEVKLI